MDDRTRDLINDIRQQLRTASFFKNWNDVRLALESLDEISAEPCPVSAYEAAAGSCEFCPVDGGGCCVCGKWN